MNDAAQRRGSRLTRLGAAAVLSLMFVCPRPFAATIRTPQQLGGEQRAADAAAREAASRAFDEAVRLQGQGTPDAVARALVKYEEAIKLWHSTGNELEEARALNNVAAIHHSRGDFVKALAIFERVLALFEKNHGTEHIEVAKTLNNIANVYAVQGEDEKAEPFQDRSVEIFVKVLSRDDPAAAAQSLTNLGMQYSNEKKFGKATRLLARAVAIDEKMHGVDDPEVADSLTTLARVYVEAQEFAKAEPLYRRALAIREKRFGAEHPFVAFSLNNLGAFYFAQGQLDKALEYDARSLAMLEKTLGQDHELVASVLTDMGAIYSMQQKFAEAERHLMRAVRITEKIEDEEKQVFLLNALETYARMLRDAKRGGEAEKVEARLRRLRR